MQESQEKSTKIPQIDGHAESSEDDDDLSGDGDTLESDSDLDTDEEEALDDVGIEMEPPCSADDISDEEAAEVFDTENVVVCQYEKITRSRNKWKFVLKVRVQYFQINCDVVAILKVVLSIRMEL